jgi:hypothetical protein
VFEEKQELIDLRNMIFGRLLSKRPGDTVSHAEIGQIIAHSDIRPQTNEYYHLVRTKVLPKLQKEMGYTLVPVPGIGYQLATVQQTLTEIPRNRERRALRQLKKGERAVDSLKDHQLTDHERKFKAGVVFSLKNKRAAVRKDAQIEQALATATPTLPRAGRVPANTDATPEPTPTAGA